MQSNMMYFNSRNKTNDLSFNEKYTTFFFAKFMSSGPKLPDMPQSEPMYLGGTPYALGGRKCITWGKGGEMTSVIPYPWNGSTSTLLRFVAFDIQMSPFKHVVF